MDIKELNERIEQLTELVKSGSEAIESMKTALIAAEKERDRLADQRTEFESKYQRVKRGDVYFSIGGTSVLSQGMMVKRYFEDDSILDRAKFLGNNYFYTASRAGEIADKINLLLKLERLHDIYCPDYKPDWERADDKHYVVRDEQRKKYVCGSTIGWSEVACVFFPTREITQKVCNILNEELDS
jgi:hypothetical protein